MASFFKGFSPAAAIFCGLLSGGQAGAAPTSRRALPSSGSFALALPGYRFSFPRDHASHSDYATEWWYYTGQLTAKSGRRFGYQLTFFRVALAPSIHRASKWATRDVIVGHLALTDVSRGKFYFAETSSRAAVGMAGASESPAHIWLRDWDLKFSPDGTTQHFTAKGLSQGSATADEVFSLNLTTTSLKKPVIHGANGVSQKNAGKGQASHYYSLTRLKTGGTLRAGNETFTVEGDSWFDHEFGSNQLGNNQTGWDWFSLQLDDGRELMLYQLRTKGGGIDSFSSGTLVLSDGTCRHLARADFSIVPTGSWKSRSGTVYPAGWKVRVPHAKLSLVVTPEVADQELRTRVTGVNYWEGASSISGSANGHGYVELTGYGGTLAGKF